MVSVLVFLLGAATVAVELPAQEQLALTNVTLIDGTGAPPRSGQTILISEARFAGIGRNLDIPAGARVIDLGGRFVIPGLIDSHVHLATDPSGRDRRELVEARLRMAIRGGVTMVRDMAGDARALNDLVADIRSGAIQGPDIRYSAIMAGPDFFEDPRVRSVSRGFTIGMAPWARAITPESDFPAAMAAARRAGATGIKLYADLDASITAEATRAAHDLGLQVWAHATTFPARPLDAARAGVNGLSHAAYLVWQAAPVADDWRERRNGNYAGIPPDHPEILAALDAMREVGTVLDATLWVTARPGDASPALVWSGEVVRLAHARGVQVSAGTDDIGDPETDSLPNLHGEMELLVRYAGFTPLEAISAATRNSAMALGLGSTHGTVRPGMVANLVVLSEDPTENIRNTRSVTAVVHRGVLLDRIRNGRPPDRK